MFHGDSSSVRATLFHRLARRRAADGQNISPYRAKFCRSAVAKKNPGPPLRRGTHIYDVRSGKLEKLCIYRGRKYGLQPKKDRCMSKPFFRALYTNTELLESFYLSKAISNPNPCHPLMECSCWPERIISSLRTACMGISCEEHS